MRKHSNKFTAYQSRSHSLVRLLRAQDLEEDYRVVFFTAYNAACEVVSERESDLRDIIADLDKNKMKLAEQQKQQKEAMVGNVYARVQNFMHAN